MVNIKKLLFALVGNNVIIVKVGPKPHWILFHGSFTWDDYKSLSATKAKWLKFEVIHIEPLGNTLRVAVKENIL